MTEPVLMVDRRHSPGGHWNDAYPFVRLHQPSLYYGVNSMLLGSTTVQTSGPALPAEPVPDRSSRLGANVAHPAAGGPCVVE